MACDCGEGSRSFVWDTSLLTFFCPFPKSIGAHPEKGGGEVCLYALARRACLSRDACSKTVSNNNTFLNLCRTLRCFGRCLGHCCVDPPGMRSGGCGWYPLSHYSKLARKHVGLPVASWIWAWLATPEVTSKGIGLYSGLWLTHASCAQG